MLISPRTRISLRDHYSAYHTCNAVQGIRVMKREVGINLSTPSGKYHPSIHPYQASLSGAYNLIFVGVFDGGVNMLEFFHRYVSVNKCMFAA